MMGMRIRGLSLTSPMRVQSASPLYIWQRVRPWMVRAWTPTSCSLSARSTMILELSSQPRRVFTVTGVLTASTTAFVMATSLSGSRIMPLPAPRPAIFDTGQPQGAPAGDLRHRAAPVDVDRVGPVPAGELRRAVGHAGRIDHRLGDMPVDLDRDGGLLLERAHLGDGLRGVPDEPVRGDELGRDHRRPGLAAQDAEGRVRHVLHRRQHHGALAQVDVCNLHGGAKIRKIGISTLLRFVRKNSPKRLYYCPKRPFYLFFIR